MTNRIFHKDLPYAGLVKFKEQVLIFEHLLNRTTNIIDIIGEIEVCHDLGLDLAQSINNEGFDAWDGDAKVQIKATRAKKTSSRTSAITKGDKSLGFDYILLARYQHDGALNNYALYKMSNSSCNDFFSYINNSELMEARVSKKKYRDMSIGQFISWSEEVYDSCSNSFKKNPKYKQRLY